MPPAASTVVIDCSVLSVLIAWRYVEDLPDMPRERRQKVLANVCAKRLPPDSAFEMLWMRFANAKRRIVTLNVLQEIWRASLQDKLLLSGPYEFESLAVSFQKKFEISEVVIRFKDLWEDEWLRPLVINLGITDAGLCWVARNENASLLTDDHDLRDQANAAEIEALGVTGN